MESVPYMSLNVLLLDHLIGNQLLIAVGLGLDTNQFLDLTIWKPSEGMQPFYVIALSAVLLYPKSYK